MAKMVEMAKKGSALKELDRTAEENYRKASILFRMERFEEALDAYRESANIWKEMANILFEKGKEESGNEFLEKAQEALSSCGMPFFKLERYEEALEIVDSALESRPENSIEWSNRGFVLSAMGRHEEALEAFEKALFFDPESPKILTS